MVTGHVVVELLFLVVTLILCVHCYLAYIVLSGVGQLATVGSALLVTCPLCLSMVMFQSSGHLLSSYVCFTGHLDSCIYCLLIFLILEREIKNRKLIGNMKRKAHI